MDKKDFCRIACILVDSREKRGHVEESLNKLGITWEQSKLDVGDYSFSAGGRDFRSQCVVELKSGVDEIYTNIMEKTRDNQITRFEKELMAASRIVHQFVLLVEGVSSMEELKNYVVPDWQMKMTPERVRANIGTICYARLRAWQSANRYNFRIECVKDKANTAARILDECYYFYRNYKALIAPRR